MFLFELIQDVLVKYHNENHTNYNIVLKRSLKLAQEYLRCLSPHLNSNAQFINLNSHTKF